jgi:hypothetical protein
VLQDRGLQLSNLDDPAFYHSASTPSSRLVTDLQPLAMASHVCAHKDVRQAESLRTCMSCGETLHLWQPLEVTEASGTSVQPSLADASPGLYHIYGDLPLTSGIVIRLVVLLPGKLQDPICCTITAASPYSEKYEALPYTWATEDGDDQKTGRVHCPNGIIPITENCEAALRQLRLESMPRQLWVDAICINQSSIKERNNQVGLMAKSFGWHQQCIFAYMIEVVITQTACTGWPAQTSIAKLPKSGHPQS